MRIYRPLCTALASQDDLTMRFLVIIEYKPLVRATIQTRHKLTYSANEKS
jgi:hypothetical protein